MNRYLFMSDTALQRALEQADAALEREVLRLRGTDPRFAAALHAGLAIEDEIERRKGG